MTPERLQRIRAVLDRRQPDLTVIADEVHKGRNIAAMLRTCDAVGIDTVHCVRPTEGYRPFRGTALGTQKWVEIKLYDRVGEPLTFYRQQGFQILVTGLGANVCDYRVPDYTRPTVLVLGSERDGASMAALQSADYRVGIPMVGMVESYNVSVACAIILAEAQYQRTRAGMYSQRRLPDAAYRQRFFQWAHPAIADYCDGRGISYPDVGEDGEIIEPASWYRRVQRLEQAG